jgi:threonyl-tRNA synthetase
MADQANIEAMRHSLAHIMAAAVHKMHPDAQFGVGPVVENGFYYDIKLAETLSSDDLASIESEMTKIIESGLSFEREEWPIDEAISFFKDNNQPFKVELLTDLKTKGTTAVRDSGDDNLVGDNVASVTTVSVYRTGDFVDLCRGPHLENTNQAGAFKLTKLAGAYWRGDEKNPQMQRVYGVAFATQDELDHYLTMLEEAEKRDHRKLGKELNLFVFSDKVGSGLPLFTPKGTILRELLNEYSQALRLALGFEKVWIPHVTKKELYETSGHWDKFGDELFLVKSQETSDELVLKPMNCPHHQQIYASQPHSYRDLPIRYLETTTVYRDEKSGELGGLSRVRSITQDDSHIFCTPEQIEGVLSELTTITKEFYASLGMKLRARLSKRDESGAYLGDKATWAQAESTLRKVLEESELEFYEAEGEAAFYGPKIDFMATDALGREHQLATPQLDFVQPERFELTYVDSDGQSKTPVMIHFALLGSIERFLSVYIEHTAGAFPVWLSPEQVRVLPVSDKFSEYGQKVVAELKASGVRVGLDDGESLGKRIRAAEAAKVPYTLVVGEREQEAGEVAVRKRGEGDLGSKSSVEFCKDIADEISSRKA